MSAIPASNDEKYNIETILQGKSCKATQLLLTLSGSLYHEIPDDLCVTNISWCALACHENTFTEPENGVLFNDEDLPWSCTLLTEQIRNIGPVLLWWWANAADGGTALKQHRVLISDLPLANLCSYELLLNLTHWATHYKYSAFKAKRQYLPFGLLTLQVSRYHLLALHGESRHYSRCMVIWTLSCSLVTKLFKINYFRCDHVTGWPATVLCYRMQNNTIHCIYT